MEKLTWSRWSLQLIYTLERLASTIYSVVRIMYDLYLVLHYDMVYNSFGILQILMGLQRHLLHDA